MAEEATAEDATKDAPPSRFDVVMKYIGAASLIFGAAVGLWQYLDTAQKTYRQPLWDKQITTYFAATNVVGKLAAAPDLEARKKAVPDFWKLFYGPMAMIQDEPVERAMIDVAHCLQQDCAQSHMRGKALHLAHACRQSLGESWSVKLPELQGKTPP